MKWMILFLHVNWICFGLVELWIDLGSIFRIACLLESLNIVSFWQYSLKIHWLYLETIGTKMSECYISRKWSQD